MLAHDPQLLPRLSSDDWEASYASLLMPGTFPLCALICFGIDLALWEKGRSRMS